MSDWSMAPVADVQPTLGLGSSFVGDLLQTTGVTVSSGTVTAALAYLVPLVIDMPLIVKQFAWENGTVVNGNVDVGIYGPTGERLVSSTPQLQVGVSVTQTFDITDLLLNPGLYYTAIATSSATATFLRSTADLAAARSCGYRTGSAPGGTLPDPTAFTNPPTISNIIQHYVTIESAVV